MSAELIAHILAICVSLGVGCTILQQGWRSRDLPAVLLGAAVAVDGIEWLAWSLCAFTPAYGTPLGEVFAVVCRLGITASIVCMVLFTRTVFRPGARWASSFMWLLIVAMVAGFFGSGSIGDWGGWRNDHVWNWIELFAQITGFAWTALEPMLYYRTLKKRVALGIADPAIANRMLLWSLYAFMFCASQIGYGIVLALYENLTALDTVLAGLTIAGELALWIAFFPPAPYLRWLRSGCTASE